MTHISTDYNNQTSKTFLSCKSKILPLVSAIVILVGALLVALGPLLYTFAGVGTLPMISLSASGGVISFVGLLSLLIKRPKKMESPETKESQSNKTSSIKASSSSSEPPPPIQNTVPYQEVKGTPLHQAAAEGNLDEVACLIVSGVFSERKYQKIYGIDERDEQGATPLHWAAIKGHLNIVQALHTYRATLDLKDHTGNTPLDLARQAGQSEVVDFLQKTLHDQKGFIP